MNVISNSKGLGDFKKGRRVFNWFRDNGFDVISLQKSDRFLPNLQQQSTNEIKVSYF